MKPVDEICRIYYGTFFLATMSAGSLKKSFAASRRCKYTEQNKYLNLEFNEFWQRLVFSGRELA